MLRASSGRVPTSPELTEILDRQRHLLRFQLARTLGPEIRALGTPARTVLDNLEALTGWQSWSSLRFAFGYSAPQAEQSMLFTMAASARLNHPSSDQGVWLNRARTGPSAPR